MPVTMTHAFVALTLDIISRVCFGFSYGLLENGDFARNWYQDIVAASASVHVMKQFPSVFRLISHFPRFASRSATNSMTAIERRRQELTDKVAAVVNSHARGEKPAADSITVFHAMLDADVPQQEKSIARLAEEAHTLTGAGSITTSTALDTTFYHLLQDQVHMERLFTELQAAMPNPEIILPEADLQKLPFLTAVICEGLRLSKSVTHRLARISPDEDLTYRGVVIPRGVPVGMTALNTLEHPSIFPDPHAFNPQRWLPLDVPETRRLRKSLVVFGAERGCALA